MEKKYDEGGNIVYDTDGQYVKFYINPKIYGMNVVSQAAYVFMDRAAVILSGNPDSKIVAEIRPIERNADLAKLIKEFNDELLNYSSFFFFSKKSLEFRNALLSSILSGSVSQAPLQNQPNESQVSVRNPQSDIDDIDKIFEEWEKDSDDIFDDKNN